MRDGRGWNREWEKKERDEKEEGKNRRGEKREETVREKGRKNARIWVRKWRRLGNVEKRE